MRYLVLTFIILMANLAFAKNHFTTKGELSSFIWSIDRYQNTQFSYDVFYYIPKTIQSYKKYPAIIFMHGGGDETMDRAGSIGVIHRYTKDLMKLADELNFILIIPSANGLNWGGHTHGMLRDLLKLARTEIPNIDSNNFGLVGHSMGGMGITRNYQWLNDQFSFFLALSAGMDQKFAREENLIHYFNTTYEHQLGIHDEYTIFLERCAFQENAVKEIEKKFSKKSGFTMKYYDGPHRYNYELVKEALAHHFKFTRRDLYQENLYGSLNFKDGLYVENNIQYHANTVNSYFWVEVLEANKQFYPFRSNLKANIDSKTNTISINFETNFELINKVRVYVSQKNINFDEKIKLVINGKTYFQKRLKNNNVTRTYLGTVKFLKHDPSFKFDGHIDIKLNHQKRDGLFKSDLRFFNN